MLDPTEVMPMLLDACPSFEQTWRVIEAENADESSETGRLHYVDSGEFIRHMVNLRLAHQTDEFAAVFSVIERLVTEGDNYVRNLGVIGYLEGLQMATVTTAGLDPETEFRPLLQPVSALWWKRINRFWAGDTTALQVTDP